MSKLISNYRISVWNDILVNGEFIEEKVCEIGADDMSYQGKAIEPQLIRKANGEKKFTFKMYKQFIDTISGEKINNPFCDYLANEKKVKLYYEDKWYDFVVKNIAENSSTHLNTYQLEDALVQELSKNGFDVALDAELMNNLGNAEELATEVLKDTDWDVESDLFTEKIEEALVYINLTQDITAYRIMETDGNMDGDPVLTTLKKSSTILGFYSSCKNKPHRFQFIYLDKNSYGDYQKDLIPVNENRVIQVQDCQYYIDIPLQAVYQVSGDYFLPPGMQVIIRNISGLQDIADTTVSNWFRGARFGFSQKTVYVPLLETYCQLYTRPGELVDGKPAEYFGYLNTEYNSPVFMENVITNSEFKGGTGWIGTYKGFTPNAKNDYGAKVKSTYGHFIKPDSETIFESAEDALKNGRFDDAEFKSYLSVEFPEKSFANQQDQCFVINSGFYDNRYKIKNILPGEEWVFDITVRGPSGRAWTVFDCRKYLDIGLYEISYKTASGGHSIGACWGKVEFTSTQHNILTITRPSNLSSDLTQEQFEAKEIKLVIKPTDKFVSSVKQFYIEDIKLYKKVTKEIEGVITILTPGDYDVEGVVTNVYSFVNRASVEKATDKKELKIENIKFEELDYSTNIPVYNDKAQKTRTVSVKESNYFNILQSISETFEAWLEIIAERGDDDNPGRITSKKIRFNKYLGSDNHAAFRYGINLKDIQRTFESKKIVTKLIVKQNSNELGKSGFCTIARAGSNPTGESNIYDFRYFHNTNMLNSSDYVAQLYYSKNPYTQEIESGKDIDPSHNNTNAQNFFNRLKKINSQLEDNGNRIIGLTKELVQLEADKKVQEGLKSTAEQSLEETRESFYALTGLYPNELDTNPFTSIELANPDTNPWGNLGILNPTWNATEHTTIKATQNGGKNSTEWTFDVTVQNNYNDDNCTIPTQTGSKTDSPREKFVPYGTVTIEDISGGVRLICGSDNFCGIKFAPVDGYSINFGYQLSYTLKVTSGTLVSIGSHGESFKDERISVDGGKTYVSANVASIQKQVGETINVLVEGTYFNNPNDDQPYLFIQPNRCNTTAVTCEITNIVLKQKTYATTDKTRTFYFQAHFTKSRGTGATTEPETVKLACSIAGKTLNGSVNHSFALVNTSGSTLSKLLSEYVEYQKQLSSATKALGTESTTGLISSVQIRQDQVNTLEAERKNLLEQKAALNKAFYSIYSRFIQEGTWISEEYVDDDKYYNDALSVLYNSCFPQVAYSINVISVSSLPGYEHFKFHLGDKTYVEDPEFFGTEDKFEVVITEQNDYLDEPSKSTVKVQNFKNQFQDLFQKITATVQQTQYSTGSYEKAAALAEADVKIRGKFVTDALEGMAGKLAVAGQTTVVMDSSGITLTDASTKDEMRLIGGAILMSIADPETGERKWKTGLTPQGISASLVTTGTLNAGNISIMNVAEPVFRWDAFGLTAYDIDWNNGDISGQTNPYKFVRFDKYGIYGIDQEGASEAVDGCNWKPTSIDEIDQLATFALTWQGLKVTGTQGVARIGRQSNNIIEVVRTKEDGSTIKTFTVDNNGHVTIKGSLTILDEDDDEEDWSEIIGDGFVKIDSTIGNNTTSFQVSSKGLLKAKNAWITGTIYATEGEIGGWKLKSGNLYKGSLNEKGGYYLITQNLDTAISVAGSSEFSDWRLVIGDSFGVDSWGNLYAKDVQLEGTITATSGKIGSWQITKEGIATTKDIKTLYTGAFLLATSTRGNNANDLVEMDNERYFMGVRALVAGGWDAASDNAVAVTAFAVADTGYMRSIHGRIGPWYYGFHSLSNTNNFRDAGLINDARSLLFPTQIVARQKTTTDWYAAGWYDIAWWVGWLTANKTALTAAYTYKPTTTTI